ncbi:MAG: hypothetical protein JXR58_01565 [Bacteroidales bacterium]|nr:hypothetical protein [Bacteroidales bacterium]
MKLIFLFLVLIPVTVFSQINIIHYVENGCGKAYSMFYSFPNKMKVIGVELDSSFTLYSSGSEVERVYGYPYDFVLIHNKGWIDSLRLFKDDSLIFSRNYRKSYPEKCRPYFEDNEKDRCFLMDESAYNFDSLTLLEWFEKPELRYFYENCDEKTDFFELKRFSIRFFDDEIDKYIEIPAVGNSLNQKQTDALRSFRFGTAFVIQDLVVVGSDGDPRRMPPLVMKVQPTSFF